MNNNYRYQLERYRGRSTRHTCPQCGRKYTFTRYIDTYNNIYINDKVGKCNRLDKCGYHYTPRQYFEDNPPLDNDSFSFFLLHREKEKKKKETTPRIPFTLPESVAEHSLTQTSAHLRWLARCYGEQEAERVRRLYGLGGIDDRVIFWQRDSVGRIRTGKIMAYDATTGKRLKEYGSVDWVHSLMQREGVLPEGWRLTQCLYGEHLLGLRPEAVVAVVEAYKTAHVGAILMPDYIWVAVDSMSGLTAERLRPLKGRRVVLFPDEGKGFTQWSERAPAIAEEVGFLYAISRFTEEHNALAGDDIVDVVERAP